MWRPKMKRPIYDIPHSINGDPDGTESVVTCWNCKQEFRVHIGYSTTLFECPHCHKGNELIEG